MGLSSALGKMHSKKINLCSLKTLESLLGIPAFLTNTQLFRFSVHSWSSKCTDCAMSGSGASAGSSSVHQAQPLAVPVQNTVVEGSIFVGGWITGRNVLWQAVKVTGCC